MINKSKIHYLQGILKWLIVAFIVMLACLTITFAFSIKPPEGNPTLGDTGNSALRENKQQVRESNQSQKDENTYNPAAMRTMPPTPVPMAGDKIYNFLLADTDAVAENTDTIMVISFNSTDKTLHVLSIPRDTMTQTNRANKKINAAYEQGGIQELEKEAAYLLGFGINRYILVNLSGVEEIINTIGGLDFNIPRDMNYDDPLQDLYIHLKKGQQHLSGNQVLQLARYRHDYTNGDIGRVFIQQELVKTIAYRVIEPENILRIPDIVGLVSQNFKTDLTAGEMLWLSDEVKDISPDDIAMSLVPGRIKTVDDLSYWLPDKDELTALISREIIPAGNSADTPDMVEIPQN